ncbi:MAG: nucleotidyl transferase AbiEii/AbiGii toxin family protein [Casimicrobiaceae bacterium]|nr:nucleotidyl transferase AbiEii/AbiGii toxin family protein [Casimicrobiaceae bacterium]
MTDFSVLEATTDVERFCRSRAWRFCFIGGLAVQRWGELRATRDADMTLLVGWGHEEPYVDALLAEFESRLPAEQAREHALRHRVLLLKHPNGTPLDIGLGGLPFEERSIERASFFRVNERFGYTTCSAEDLIVHKVFAARPQDWVDVQAILRRQGDRLNWAQIETELEPLLDLLEVPERLDILRKMKAAP